MPHHGVSFQRRLESRPEEIPLDSGLRQNDNDVFFPFRARPSVTDKLPWTNAILKAEWNNIAEGTGREGDKEAKHFFNIAKGSLYEVVSLLHIMRDKKYLAPIDFELLYKHCDEIAQMLSGLISK